MLSRERHYLNSLDYYRGKQFLESPGEAHEKFSLIAKENGFAKALEFLSDYLNENPSHRYLAISLYVFFKNVAGRSSIADALASIFVNITKIQSEQSQAIWKTPLVCETGTSILQRIGEGADQAAFTMQQLQLGELTEKPILLAPESNTTANSAMMPYYADAFEIITSKDEVKKLEPLKHYSFYNSFLVKASDALIGHNGEVVTGVHDILTNAGNNPFIFNLKSETEEGAVDFLRKFGLSDDDKFVTIHLREEGYADASHHELRNYSVEIIEEAIDFIISQGLKVIKIGHKKMTPVQKRAGLIDLSAIESPDEVDIFACAKAEFFMGTLSGPFSLAYHFGTPTLQIGVLANYSHARLNGLVQLQPIQNLKTGKILTLKEIQLLDLQKICAANPYKLHGLSPVQLDGKDVLRATKDMFELLTGLQTKMMNDSFHSEKASLGLHPQIMFTQDSLMYF